MSNQGHNAVPGRQGFQPVTLSGDQRASAPAPTADAGGLADWVEEGFDADEAGRLLAAGIELPLAMDYMEDGTHDVADMISRYTRSDLPPHEDEPSDGGFEVVEPCPDCGSMMVYQDPDGYLHVDRTRGCWLGRNERELTVEDRAAMAVALYAATVAENGTVADVSAAAGSKSGWAEIAAEMVEMLERVSNDPDADWVDAVYARSVGEMLLARLKSHPDPIF